MDLGFERAGYEIGLAFDKNPDSIASYKHNRNEPHNAYCEDIRDITLARLDELHGGLFTPEGVIGGPPCQSFSRANPLVEDEDPRHELPLVYARLLSALNERSPVGFFVLENVPGLCSEKHATRFEEICGALEGAGFTVTSAVLNASDYQTPQSRDRLFVVGINPELFPHVVWTPPAPTTTDRQNVTVRAAIANLVEPVRFSRNVNPDDFPVHRNHWCMRPKSPKFSRPGALVPGRSGSRSFKTLSWDQPSYTVAFGNREVHIHPDCHRRLSVYEAMRLQG
ncbi:MAG TPA: DNA cytosine methyltransferase, partial [Longimicrobium sp.]|nr:DNA cytosine methyltransferase [Longimicrobium sp.]